MLEIMNICENAQAANSTAFWAGIACKIELKRSVPFSVEEMMQRTGNGFWERYTGYWSVLSFRSCSMINLSCC